MSRSIVAVLWCLVCPIALAQSAGQQGQLIDGEYFRDPTQPAAVTQAARESLGVSAAAATNFTVNFVRSGGSSPMAVINQQRLQIGDRIEGALLTDIRPGSVVLSINGFEQEISVFQQSVRRPVQ